MIKLKSPYSFFGSKTKVANIIWQGLGAISNYIEPFAGSLSVLLLNPNIPKIETVNDKDHYISNFWRAISSSPDDVAKYADFPLSEVDVHTRNKWFLESTNDFKLKMESNPDYFDVKIAGWWVWGMSSSIGNNWLHTKGLKALPALSCAGGGIHGMTHSIYDWFKALSDRLRRVRVCCGDYSRILSPSLTYNSKGIGDKDITAVFLDPPYEQKGRDKVYNNDDNIFKDVCKWAINNGDNPKLRIALCGYEGDHNIPDTWQTYSWKSAGGFSSLGDSRGKTNSSKERIWFNPTCLKVV